MGNPRLLNTRERTSQCVEAPELRLERVVLAMKTGSIRQQLTGAMLALAIALMTLVVVTQSVRAQTLRVLYTFYWGVSLGRIGA